MRIERVRTATSRGRVEERLGEQQGTAASPLVAGQLAFLVEKKLPAPGLTVAVVAPVDQRQKLLERVMESKLVAITEEGDSADLMVRCLEPRQIADAGDPCPFLAPLAARTWAVVGADGRLQARLRPDDREGVAGLVEDLVRLARFRGLRGLENPDPESRLRERVALRLLDRRGEAAQSDPQYGVVVVEEGDRLDFEIENCYDREVWVSLVELDSDHGITVLMPRWGYQTYRRGGQRLAPGEVLRVERDYFRVEGGLAQACRKASRGPRTRAETRGWASHASSCWRPRCQPTSSSSSRGGPVSSSPRERKPDPAPGGILWKDWRGSTAPAKAAGRWSCRRRTCPGTGTGRWSRGSWGSAGGREMSELAGKHAAVIGINAYGNGLAMLCTAVADARAVAAALKEGHGYSHPVELVDEEATSQGIVRLLEERLLAEVQPDSGLVLYFAGHGVALDGDEGPRGYLIPQDARSGEPETWLPMGRVQGALSRLPCRHLLVVLDCCFAGSFRWASTRKTLLPARRPLYDSQYARFLEGTAWQVLTSASHQEEAQDVVPGSRNTRDQEGGERHSPFAAALLGGLAGESDSSRGRHGTDGVVTATELYQYVFEELVPAGRMRRQTPGCGL